MMLTLSSRPSQLPADWHLPEFRCDSFAARQSRYCVLIPVINEGTRFLRQLSAMASAGLGIDIIIADGGSSDGSTDVDRLRQLGVRALLTKTSPGRLSTQLRMGFAYALSEGYNGIITIDGNGKDGIDAIPSFAAALDQGFDFIQGSRYIEGGAASNTPLDRELGVRYVHAPLISLVAGFHYTDTTNGFRAFSARLLTDPRLRPFRAVFDSYNLHYYISVRAPRLGYRIRELPVRRDYPANAPAPTKINGLSGKLHILGQTFLACAGAYNPRG